MLYFLLWEDKRHLTCVLKPMKKGYGKILECEIIGVDIDAIQITEDREHLEN